MAARALKPELLTTPVGRAMRKAFARNSQGVSPSPILDGSEKYKLKSVDPYRMDAREYLKFVQQFAPHITQLDLDTELAAWNTIDLPELGESNMFRVTEAMAHAHYNY
jgi:hypothetical protein